MASFTISSCADAFPVGTSVGAYLARYRINGSAPSGSATATATVASNGSLAFTGLADDTEYVAYALVSGQYRYRAFQTSRPRYTGQEIVGPLSDGHAPVWSESDDALVATPVASSTGTTARQRPRSAGDGEAIEWGEPEVVDLRDFDHVRPWETATGAAMTSGQPTLSNSVRPLTSADVGKVVIVKPNSGTTLFKSTIQSVNGSGVATLADNAPFTVTSQRMMIGWDETTVLQDALDALAADGVYTRRCVLVGMHRVSQLIVPTGIELCGVSWGKNYPASADLADAARVGACLKQLPGANTDLLRFAAAASNGGNYYAGPSAVRDLVLLSPEHDVNGITYTAGSGLALVDEEDNPLAPQDGFVLERIHAIHFFHDGFYFPAAPVPGIFDRLRAFYNGRYGFNIAAQHADAGQGTHLLNCSADGNGEGGARFHGFGKAHSIIVTNFKSEKGAFLVQPGSPSGDQESALIFDECDETPVDINGTSHIASADTHSTTAPGPAISITSATDKRPKITFAAVSPRVQTAQTNNVANAVTLRDAIVGVDIPRTVKAGHWPPDTVSRPLDAVADAESVIPREHATGATALTSGLLRLTHFTCKETATRSKLRVALSTAGGTPTLARLGVYTEAANGDLTLVASSATSTAILQSGTEQEVTLSTPYKFLAGKRYAVGPLVVTSNTAPQISACSVATSAIAGRTPRRSSSLGGQTDLPASIAAGSLGNTSNAPYVELVT